MLPLLFFLPLVVAVPLKTERENYILDVQNGTLMNVELKEETLSELDLSGMGLRALEKNALDNLSDLTSLDLSNNSLHSLPDFVFSNLTKLEHLSLAENKISEMKYLFVGLENLRVLNISYNPVLHIRRGHLFGMPKSVTIYTEGNMFWSMSTGAFTNIFLKDEEESKIIEEMKNISDSLGKNSAKAEDETIQRDTEAVQLMLQNEQATKEFDKDIKVKLCISDNTVTMLEILEKNETLLPGCTEVSIDRKQRTVSLRGLGIEGFQEGWYRLRNLPIATLDLSSNNINEITKETLNDLPENIVYVNLLENRIRRIWSQVIDNPYLKMLNLKENIIQVIEEGAFKQTNLTGLFLTGNQLENLNFVANLPETLTEFVLTENQITSIPDDAFSKLSRLAYLNLADNQITRLQNNAFKGLDSLQVLIMTKNSLVEIEPQAFKDLKQLTTLYLYHNTLTDLKRGTFADLESLKDLNLAWNKLKQITKDTFGDLPKTLDFLHLDYNEIASLDKCSFVDVPRFTLSLNGNKISSIPQGAFDLPTLQDLHLNNNTFVTFDGDSYRGLPQLKRLWLSENQITEIHKGACKHLRSLNILDISKNPFHRLDSGVLYGLSSAKGNYVYIYTNQLKEMQGGIFDDV